MHTVNAADSTAVDPAQESAGVDLDPEVALSRRRARGRRLHTEVIPRHRLFGSCLLIGLVYLHNRVLPGQVDPSLTGVFALTVIAYSLLSWWVLRRFYEPPAEARLDLATFFLGTDIFTWVFAIYCTGGESSLLFLLMVLRPADQTNTSFHTAFAFVHLSVFSYAVFLCYLSLGEGRPLEVEVELLKLLVMYCVGIYLSGTARTAERMRDRVRNAVHLARELIVRLEAQNEQLETSERRIRAREQRSRDFSQAASDWFWESDAALRFTSVSDRIALLTRFRSDQLVGQPVWTLGADPGEASLCEARDVLETRTAFRGLQFTALGPDGEKRYLRLNGKPVFGEGQSFCGYRGTGTDETEQVLAERRRRQAESLLVGITENLPGVLFRRKRSADGSWDYQFVSRGARSGRPAESDAFAEAVGDVHPEDTDRVDRAVTESERTLTPLEIEYRIGTGETEPRWVHCGAQPREVEPGEYVWDGIFLDITERKRLESELARSQKLQSVGRLAAGIAHEINTPSQYVGDNIRFLDQAFSDLAGVWSAQARLIEAVRAGKETAELVAAVDAALEAADADYLLEEVPEAITQAFEGVGRISSIVLAMKEFSHPGGTEKSAVDLNHLVESTLTVARHEWSTVAEVELDLALDLPQVLAHQGELSQALLNLIVNAAHAIGDRITDGERGRIRIATRSTGSSVELSIGDTGGGIPGSVRDKIFEPFYTTKEVGKGTGQGLAITRSVIEDKHRGRLTFEVEAGVGTTFTVSLPAPDPGPELLDDPAGEAATRPEADA